MTAASKWLLRPWVGMCFLCALGACLRARGLGDALFYSDEAFSWRVAACDWAEMAQRVSQDTHPLGHFVALKGWMLVFGSSPAALRGLSAMFGLGAMVCAYAIVVEAGASARWANSSHGALAAALLMALHAGPLEYSRTARMYAMAAFLSLLATYCLLRAARPPGAPAAWKWWTAYGLVSALCLHTHNMAIPTMLAQGTAVAALVLRPVCAECRGDKKGDAAPTVLSYRAPLMHGMCLAWMIACVMYSPWLAAMLEQARRVRENFWISAPTVEQTGRLFVHWATGIPGATAHGEASPVPLTLVFLFVAAIVWRAMRMGQWPGQLLLAQVVAPWIFLWLMYIAFNRPLFQARYLALGQVSLLCLVGVVLNAHPTPARRFLVVAPALAASLFGTWTYLSDHPTGAPPMQGAARYLTTRASTGDRIVTTVPEELNMLRYYLAQEGGSPAEIVLFRKTSFSAGHMNHASSIAAEELQWEDEPPPTIRRLWVARSTGFRFEPPDGWDQTEHCVFQSSAYQTSLELTLWERGASSAR